MAVAADLRAELLRILPDERRVSDGESVLDQHAGDLSYHPAQRPDVVVFPESTAEVAAVLDAAAGGPPDLTAIGDVMRRHGITPAP